MATGLRSRNKKNISFFEYNLYYVIQVGRGRGKRLNWRSLTFCLCGGKGVLDVRWHAAGHVLCIFLAAEHPFHRFAKTKFRLDKIALLIIRL
jgi:hypothetical protein